MTREGPRPGDPVIPAVPIRNTLLRLVKAGIKSSRTVVRVGSPNKGPSDVAVNARYEHVRCAYDTVEIEGRQKGKRERERERGMTRTRTDSFCAPVVANRGISITWNAM